jgi:ubiquinone biosynthesis protein
VPRKLPGSSPDMTVMSRVEGRKITDVAHLTKEEKRRLAGALAKTCILRPIQDLNETSIFHGDPHAGNLAYTFEGSRPRIILYDWAMLGRLNRMDRFAMVLLAFGLVSRSSVAVYLAADIITNGQMSNDKKISANMMHIIDQVIANRPNRIRGVFSSIEELFEAFTFQGVTFRADLLMYQKALVTLKGVMADIDPNFDRDDYIVWSAMCCFWNDLFKFNFHRLILTETWKLSRFSIGRFLDIQKLILKLGWELGLSGPAFLR